MEKSADMSAHLNSEEVAAYLDGGIEASERLRIEAHLSVCAECTGELIEVRRLLPRAERRFKRRWVIAPAAAAAAAAAILFWGPGLPDRGSQQGVLREESPGVASAPVAQEPVGAVAVLAEFRWAAVTSADLYRVTLYDAAGTVIWQTDTRETHVAAPDTPRLDRGALYLWQVAARVGWDQWVNSELTRFSISEP